MNHFVHRPTRLLALACLAFVTAAASATPYNFRVPARGVRSVIAQVALQTPNAPLFYEGKHTAWLDTGHSWAWYSSGYVTSAAVGAYNFEAQLTNAGGTSHAITLNVAADNTFTKVTLNGVTQGLPDCATYGYSTVCPVPLTLAPGKSVITLSVSNAGATDNPAGFSAWVVDGVSGAILADTTINSGVSSWYKY